MYFLFTGITGRWGGKWEWGGEGLVIGSLWYQLVTFLATGVSTCVLIMTLQVGWITSLDASHLLLFAGHRSKMEGH